MKIQLFNGGLGTRTRPQYLQTNQGVVHTNVDFNAGTLAPIKSKVATTIDVEQFQQYYRAQKEWVSSTTNRDYIEYQKILYYTDRLTTPQRYDGTDTFNLGIAAPPNAPALANIQDDKAPVQDITVVHATAGGNLPNRTLYYLLANTIGSRSSDLVFATVTESGELTMTGPTRTLLSPIDSGTDSAAATNQVTFSGMEVADAEPATTVTVYRLWKGTYRSVGDIDVSPDTLVDSLYDISANDAWEDTKELQTFHDIYQYLFTYYNSALDIESGLSPISDELDVTYGSNELIVFDLTPSTDPQVDKKRIYRVGGDITIFTLVDEIPNATDPYTDITKDTDVVGTLLTTEIDSQAPAGLSFLTEAYAMLFGAVGNRLRFTPVGKPYAWPVLHFLTFEDDITSIAAVSNGVIVSTKFRSFLVTGTGPDSLSQQLLSADQGNISFYSTQVISGTAIWASTDGLCASSGNQVAVISKPKLGKIALTPIDSIVFDEVYYCMNDDGTTLAYEFQYEQGYFTRKFGVQTLAIAEDELYGYSEAVLYKLFASDEPETIEYKSPRLVEGRITDHKTYKRVYIYSKGVLQFNILINDILVASKDLNDNEDNHTIIVPQELQRGFYIQFEVTGTGEIFEIEYLAGKGKQDG